jgi:hypothetical protein
MQRFRETLDSPNGVMCASSLIDPRVNNLRHVSNASEWFSNGRSYLIERAIEYVQADSTSAGQGTDDLVRDIVLVNCALLLLESHGNGAGGAQGLAFLDSECGTSADDCNRAVRYQLNAFLRTESAVPFPPIAVERVKGKLLPFCLVDYWTTPIMREKYPALVNVVVDLLTIRIHSIDTERVCH